MFLFWFCLFVMFFVKILYKMAADVKLRKTPTTKARTLDNLLEDGAVHIRN
ncbi:hypothetical protein HanXRQr2_Chr10g0435991 [Helianthus annuus]|uniref:Uncharacterized protein n=1 Tax=Helianthus annuus TaxID=4232 RepID=A0A9K3HXH5_HELAN|nr:hypothetical protein HanXRQr2_Chr10g0435991 [Helianthus annuus]